jgi:Tfp pilus assembly protein PilX
MKRFHATQRGAALVVALIMLVVLTLFVLSVINMSTTNLRVAGNTQARNEALAATQQAIELVASRDFTVAPAATTVAVDINGDGSNDYTVAVDRPLCMNAVPIKTTELDVTLPGDVACFASSASTSAGVVGGTPGGNSLCANTQWDVRATVSDTGGTGTQTTVTIHQGLGQRVALGTTC